MNKLLFPAALTLALTASAAAFAMSRGIDPSLYRETSPFTAVKAPAFTGTAYWQSADRTTQRASVTPMAESHNWTKPAATEGHDLYDPE